MINKYQNIIYAISFTDLFAIGLISPLLGNHLRSLGISHFVIGILGSSYSGIQVISGPLIGSWSDVGDRKNVLMTTLCLCGLCYLALGFVNWIVGIYMIRILLGCLKHTQGSCKAMISELFPSNKQAEILSRSAVFGTIGFNAGPLIGGYISEFPNGFMYISCMTFSFFIFNIFLCSFLPSFTSKSSMKKPLQVYSNMKQIDWVQNWNVFALRFLFGISMSFYFYNEAFYLKALFDFNQRQLGYLMSFRGVVQTCTIFSLGYIKRKFYTSDSNCLRRIFHFFLVMSVSSFFLCLVNSSTFYVVFMIPFVISLSVLRISTMELLLGTCEKGQIGTFSGVSNSIMSISRSVTPIVSGIVTDSSSVQTALFLSSIASVLGALLSLDLSKNFINVRKED